MSELSYQHRERAREIVATWKRDIGQVVKYERMEEDIARALSVNDAKITEILSGFIHAGVEFDDERIGYVSMQIDRRDLNAALALYEKLTTNPRQA